MLLCHFRTGFVAKYLNKFWSSPVEKHCAKATVTPIAPPVPDEPPNTQSLSSSFEEESARRFYAVMQREGAYGETIHMYGRETEREEREESGEREEREEREE